AMVGGASLLQRLSAICFIMVVALMLRTVTDNEIVGRHIGSIFGMLYAAGLLGWGWWSYRKQKPLAPVFAVCGALLMFAVVVETHEHFEAVPTPLAYLLLTLVGVIMSRLSHAYRVAVPVYVGTVGMALAGVALDFPAPVFPYLLVLLLIANLIGTIATQLQRCSWLRWMLLAITVFMMQVWGFRLGFEQSAGQGTIPFDLAGYIPAVTLVALAYLVIAYLGLTGKLSEKVSRIDFALPAVTVLWAFPAIRYVISSSGMEGAVYGICSSLFAVAMGFVAKHLYSRDPDGEARGVTSMMVAAALLLMLALPMALGNRIVGLAGVAIMALLMAHLSHRWKSGGLRLLSYALQVHASLMLVLILWRSETAAPSMLGAVSSGTLALLAFLHFLWARKYKPFKESKVFSEYDKRDRLATLVLYAALLSGFFTLRVGIHQVLVAWLPAASVSSAFVAAQTTLVNFSAAGLAIYAFFFSNRELRNVAIFITVIGGAKVFALDLMSLKGVPVVASVFSFGVTAFFESIIFARWNVRETSQAILRENRAKRLREEGGAARPPRRMGF
ncbi:MAG: hypothetical protein C0624_04605, partial [Desulfuromonas sp.]